MGKPGEKEITDDNRTFYELGLNTRNHFIESLKKTNRRAYDQFQYNESRYRQEAREFAAKCGALEYEVAELKATISSMVKLNNECTERLAKALEEEPVLQRIDGVCIPNQLMSKLFAYLDKQAPYSRGLATQIRNQMNTIKPTVESIIADMQRNRIEDEDDRRELGLDE